MSEIARLRSAAAADPLAADPPRGLATLAFARWQQDPTPEMLGAFERYNAAALELEPDSAPVWSTAGDRYLEIYRKTGRKADLTAALDAYRRAVRLYPGSGLHRAKLALALRIAGDWRGFQREAAAALRLDDLTPHRDKKLPAELRDRLMQGSP